MPAPKPFQYDAEVPPGTTRHVRHEVSETYLGDPVEIPVTVINGERDGPRVFMTAALHGDELNGVKVLQEGVSRPRAPRRRPGGRSGTRRRRRR